MQAVGHACRCKMFRVGKAWAFVHNLPCSFVLLCLLDYFWHHPCYTQHYMQAQLAEQERQRQNRMQATKHAQRQAALAAAAVTGEPTSSSQLPAPSQDGAEPQNGIASAMDEGTAGRLEEAAILTAPAIDSSSGRKRRRTTVDYVALNKQLEAEAAGSLAQSLQAQPGVQTAQQPLNFVTNAPADTVAVHANNAAPNHMSDTPLESTALQVEQLQQVAQQPREGDRM